MDHTILIDIIHIAEGGGLTYRDPFIYPGNWRHLCLLRDIKYRPEAHAVLSGLVSIQFVSSYIRMYLIGVKRRKAFNTYV